MSDIPPRRTEPMPDATRRRSTASDPVTSFFGGSPFWVLVKLVMLSIVIGVILAVLGLDARAILHGIRDLFYDLFDNIWDALDTLGRWFLLGAVIVFPLWLISRLFRMSGRG